MGVRSVGKSSFCRSSGRPRHSCMKVCVNEGRGVNVRGSNVSIHCVSIGRMAGDEE